MAFDIIVILIATAIIWGASELLSRGVHAIGVHYRINPSVRGATLDAVGSSFPEFCTVVFALSAGSFEAGIGAIAGSALYNVLVIPALSVAFAGQLAVRKEVIRRDGFLYAVVVVGLIVAIWLGPQSGTTEVMHAIPWWIGLLAVLVYVAYVIYLVLGARAGALPEADSGPKETIEFKPAKVATMVFFGIAGIGAATHFLVDAGLALFRMLDFSEAIAGVTVLAAATSLPDTLLSVFAARRGDADGAVANAFGSNSFDILICLGLPILIIGGVQVEWATSWPVLAFLLISTIASVFFLLTEWTLSRREAVIMGGLYVLFIVLAFLGYLGPSH